MRRLRQGMRNMKRGHSVRRTAQQRGDDRALRDYGIESCRLQTENANRLLTGEPETVDNIKYMETVCD